MEIEDLSIMMGMTIKIILFLKKKRVNLDKPSKTPLENILTKFYFLVKKKKYCSDLKLSLEVEKIQSEIRKKISI